LETDQLDYERKKLCVSRVCVALQMFGLVRSAVQMLDQGFCDVDGARCTVGPKGYGKITIID